MPIAKKVVAKIIFYLILLLLIPISYFIGRQSPHSNFKQLIQLAKADLSEDTFKSPIGYLRIYPSRGYIVVLYTGNAKEFQPAEFIIIFKRDKILTVELINGAGRENCRYLIGETAKFYLVEHQIELKDLEEVSKFH